MKPRVIELLLVTTVPVMILARRDGVPNLWLVLGDAGRRHAVRGCGERLQLVIDRDIDRGHAPHRAPPARHRRPHRRAGARLRRSLTVVSTLVLGFLVNWLAAGARRWPPSLFYVFVYTMWLKRRTPQNIVWGGVAGCMPVLIGWAAVTGTLGLGRRSSCSRVDLPLDPAALLAAVDALPRRLRRRVSVPMLGGRPRPRRRSACRPSLYAWAMVACSLLLIPVAPWARSTPSSRSRAGGWFVLEAHRLYARALAGERIAPMRVFHASIGSLSLVFLGIAVDALLFR